MLTFTQTELQQARQRGDVIAHASIHENGVAFRDVIESPDGATFHIFRESHHSHEDIARAKRWILNNRDAIQILVFLPEKTR